MHVGRQQMFNLGDIVNCRENKNPLYVLEFIGVIMDHDGSQNDSKYIGLFFFVLFF